MSKAIVLEFRYSTSAFAGAAMRGRKVQRNLHFSFVLGNDNLHSTTDAVTSSAQVVLHQATCLCS